MSRKISKPHYEKRGEDIIAKRTRKVDAKKVIAELNKLIKKSRKIEKEFRMTRRNEAVL